MHWGQIVGGDGCSSLTANSFWNKTADETAEALLLLHLPFRISNSLVEMFFEQSPLKHPSTAHAQARPFSNG